MASQFAVDDKVFVPASRIPGMEGHHSAFYETRIAEFGIRKVKVHYRVEKIQSGLALVCVRRTSAQKLQKLGSGLAFLHSGSLLCV